MTAKLKKTTFFLRRYHSEEIAPHPPPWKSDKSCDLGGVSYILKPRILPNRYDIGHAHLTHSFGLIHFIGAS